MIKQLTRQLGSPEEIKQDAAQKALVDAGSAAIPALLEALQLEIPIIRMGAARILGETGDEQSEKTLIGMLHESSPEVRHAIIYALGPNQSAQSKQALKRVVIEDTDPFCRRQPSIGLQRQQTTRSTPKS
jgi:HEAT repeat protein